jgi:hypothetical protein
MVTDALENLWVTQSVPLRFALGEFRFLRISVPAVVLNLHFTHPAAVDLDAGPCAGGYPAGIDAALLRSHPVERELPRLSWLPDSIRYIPAAYKRYYVDLHGSFAEYLKKFSGKSRSTLTRKVRKFAELSGGELSWLPYRSPAEVETFYGLARGVSQKTYQEKLLGAGLPETERFQQELHSKATKDAVRGYILFRGEDPVSYLLCMARSDILFYEYLGYDPALAQWSPGTVLQYLALESLFSEQHFNLFDFGEGEAPHKAFFATGFAQCADIYFFRRTWRAALLVGTHYGILRLSERIAALLEALQVKDRIKKFIRRNA